MRARDVVGRRIVAVDQTRWYDEESGEWVVTLHGLTLEGGVGISLYAQETIDQPTVVASVVKPRRAPA